MEYIHVKNLTDYQPSYSDGRNLIWIRWDIAALTNRKICKVRPIAARWLFIVLICLETEEKKAVEVDLGWLSLKSGIEKNHIPNYIRKLQEADLIVTNCNKPLQNVPTDRHTDIQTNNNAHFEEIWKRYPNRVGKKHAERHYKATVKTDEDRSNIHKAMDNYLKSDRVKKGFVQNGSTWFNQWQDWVDKPIKEKDDYEQHIKEK